MPLFGRQVFVRAGPAGQEGFEFRDLRIAFDVDMSIEPTPNKAVIRIWGVSKNSIGILQQTDIVVQLLAGYDIPRLIFQGEPIKGGVKQSHQGVERILTIEAQDGGKAYRTARINASFEPQTTLQQVFDEVATQMGLPVVAAAMPDVRFPHGLTLVGHARDVMGRIAGMASRDWMIRDGVLYLVDEDGDTGESVVEFSADRGNLIGSPAPKKEGIEVTGLLDPSVRPGRRFGVQAEDHSGIFKATDVRFTGDTNANQFYVIATGKEA